MFFPERIKNILPTDRVLEIGPGSQPHPRADVYLEKCFDSEEALAQSGFAEPKDVSEKVVYYGGGSFPFADKEFDYVICSHVIEHINLEEVPLFISELERIAPKGYIEFPTARYEFMCHAEVHKTLIEFEAEMITFFDKKEILPLLNEPFVSDWRKIYYSCIHNNFDVFASHKSLFFFGKEWAGTIAWRIEKDYNAFIELINFPDEQTSLQMPIQQVELVQKVKRKIRSLFLFAR